MISLQEAERLLERFSESKEELTPAVRDGASEFLTTLVSAGAFRKLDATEVRAALMADGVTASASEYAVRVLRKMGVVS